MNMGNKYFTPKIEDFRVGYEFEYDPNNELEEYDPKWLKGIIRSDSNWEYIFKRFENNKARVPFLIKEQIEAEGWEQRGDDSYFYNKEFLSIYNYLTNILIVISLKEDVLFKGYCPSINEFRYITKNLLKINQL